MLGHDHEGKIIKYHYKFTPHYINLYQHIKGSFALHTKWKCYQLWITYFLFLGLCL